MERAMLKVLVVGASRGIGAALVQQLAARGDEVWASTRGSHRPEVAGSVQWIGGVDIATEAGRLRLLEALPASLDCVLHSAGVLHDDDLQSLSEASLEAQLRVNAIAPLLLARELLPRLRPGGRLAFLTSRMGSITDNSSGSHYGYRMSKVALNMAAKSLAIDLEPRGVAVFLLHPGFVRTAMTRGQGLLAPEESAALLLRRLDSLSLADTGSFWHANGEALPW
jgi:NAD(P)-dependent dehydrogenase (short-subunit alcohol dehydrogenase family)